MGRTLFSWARSGRIYIILAALALTLALALSALLAWRHVHDELQATAQRAAENGARLVSRATAELEKLQPLHEAPCTPDTVRVLREAVYGSLAQIREIGLIRNGLIVCTSHGAPPHEVRIDAHLLKPGIALEVAVNQVVVNNRSLFIYLTQKEGITLDAVVNPALLADFESGFPHVRHGRLTLEVVSPVGRTQASTPAPVYQLGEASTPSPLAFARTHTAIDAPLRATAEATALAWWEETRRLLPLLLALTGALVLVGGVLLRRWIDAGNLERLRFERALAQGELLVHYQPIVSAADGTIRGVEALLRWQHPRRGLLNATRFLEIFGIESLAAPLLRHVLDRVAADFARVPTDRALWCSVNVAPQLLEDAALMGDLAHRAGALGSGRLRLEITEREPLTEIGLTTMHELRARGIAIGMDDLGTGHANLAQLQRMPFDFVKIDGVLVSEIRTAEGVSPVVRSLIDLARTMGAEVIVEGVETRVQAEALTAAGADLLQGFHIDAARPFDDILARLTAPT